MEHEGKGESSIPMPAHYRFQNLTGRKFGRMNVIEYKGKPEKGRGSLWLCQCECGTRKVVYASNLKKGDTKSCGCLHKEIAKASSTTHGDCGTPEYEAWCKIKQRCYKKTNRNYYRYGGRGITVCDRWLESFENFLEDMGPRPVSKESIDRINNNGNYEPENCRWANRKEQNRNTSRNRMLTFNGKTMCMAEWAERLNLDYQNLARRLNKFGWSVEKSLTKPGIDKKE